MSGTEGDGQQAAAQEAIVETPAVEGDDTPAIDPKIEAEAKEMGWVPKDRFKGDPEAWRPADEFVKRGKEILPIVNAENRRLKAELERVNRESADQLARVEKMSRSALKVQREQIEARYEALKLKAVEQGDMKGYAQAEKMQKDAVKAFDAEVDDKKPDKGKDDLSASDREVMNDWLDDNPWFGTDEDLRYAANRLFDRIGREMPDKTLRERLAEIRTRMEEKFPTHFAKKPKANGNGHAMVESANGRGPDGGDQSGDAWNKLPQDIKRTAKMFIEDERIYDHLIGAKAGQPLTPAQLRQAREIYAREYNSN